MSGMQICSGCDRHVRADEPQCPFCGIASTTVRSSAPRWALALIAGSLLATASCDKGGDADKPKPETKSETKTETKTDVKSDDGGDVKADDGGDAKADDGGDAKADDGGDTKADDGGAEAGSTGATETGADAAGSTGGSAPADDGAAAGDDGPSDRPIAKPKYGLARPRPVDPRPAKKYGAPPRPKPEPKPIDPVE